MEFRVSFVIVFLNAGGIVMERTSVREKEIN